MGAFLLARMAVISIGIENKKSFPLRVSIFYICDYLSITPMKFFNTSNSAPIDIAKITEQL